VIKGEKGPPGPDGKSNPFRTSIQFDYTNGETGTWVAPPNINYVFVHLIGAGGNGGDADVTNDLGGGGGGQGAELQTLYNVVPGTTYYYQINAVSTVFEKLVANAGGDAPAASGTGGAPGGVGGSVVLGVPGQNGLFGVIGAGGNGGGNGGLGGIVYSTLSPAIVYPARNSDRVGGGGGGAAPDIGQVAGLGGRGRIFLLY